MLTAFVMAVCAVSAFFVTAARVVPFRRLLGYGVALDVVFTVSVAALFFGTLTGLLIATLSGLFMALFITAARAIFGYDRAAAIYWHRCRPVIIWTATPPRWRRRRPTTPTPARDSETA